MLTRRAALIGTGAASATLAMPSLIRAQSSAPIRIGEINSYSTQPEFTTPYRNGWQLALQHVNDLGGVAGRKLEIISRDDAGQPENAVRIAGELVQDEHVDLLAGGYLSDVGLAISAYALKVKKVYVAGEPLTDALVWDKGNRYTYRLRPSTYMQVAMVVNRAVGSPAKRWVTVAPDDEYGRSAVKWFKQMLGARRPDVAFVGEQWPALGKIDAGATVAALGQPAPDAIFNALFGADLTAFVRQGNTSGLFENRGGVSLLTGEPEYLEPLGAETPPGWIVTGYPWGSSDEPSNKQFVLDYQGKYHENPKMGSVVGFALVNSIVAGILKSGGTDSEQMADGFGDAAFTTPFGIARWRAIDHQSTLGTYVGKLAVDKGQGAMVDWRYVGGEGVMPSDADVRKMRPQG
jgi:branched-chain amino acid transport system substrate-binding protein